jgi:hypothetical protein
MGSGIIAPSFLTLALDGGEWLALCPSRFTTRERSPGTFWKGGCVGPVAGLDDVEKRNILPCRESNSGSLDHSPSLNRLSYPDSYFVSNISWFCGIEGRS